MPSDPIDTAGLRRLAEAATQRYPATASLCACIETLCAYKLVQEWAPTMLALLDRIEELEVESAMYRAGADEATRLIRLMHDPNAAGEYCACSVCDFLEDR